MATVNILPDADVSNSPAWTIGTGSDVYAMLASIPSAGGHVTSDSSDIEATATGKICEVDMSTHPVFGATGTTINSVTASV